MEAELGQYRRELLAHCYRMTGSLGDAEDALQDAMLRAWRARDSFEGRASLRTWLYRIATNACLDLVAERRGRSMPYLERPPGDPSASDAAWLEPFPDALIEDDPEHRPDALYTRREATRLAFVTALQRLPARQRAVLILRDVVALSAEEVAETLDITVATANSLLQRARDTLGQPHRRPPVDAARLADMLARYLRAWETGDTGELIALLKVDAITSMPPVPLWLAGRDAIVAYMVEHVLPGGPLRLLPCAANGEPGFAVYRPGGFASISLLDFDDDGLVAFHSFMAVDPVRFGLPREFR